jgi:hypothetical protein
MELSHNQELFYLLLHRPSIHHGWQEADCLTLESLGISARFQIYRGDIARYQGRMVVYGDHQSAAALEVAAKARPLWSFRLVGVNNVIIEEVVREVTSVTEPSRTMR